MPKSQHSRGKRTVRNKPRVSPAAAVSATPGQAVPQAPAATGTGSPKLVASPKPVASLKAAAQPKALPPAYPYLMSDLKRIGILTGVVIVILAVLYVVLT